MSDTNSRHFATLVASGEEVIILGYRSKSNEVLVAFPSAMPASESQVLRQIALSDAAQRKDYLVDIDGNSVLEAAHHPASGMDWQTHLIRQGVTGRSSQVRKLTMKELNFYDASQKALFGGYGESVEPKKVEAPVVAPAVAPIQVAPAPAPDTAMVDALTALAATQQAILEKLTAMDAPKPKKAAAKRPVRKRGPNKKKIVAATDTQSASVDAPSAVLVEADRPE